jgi:hypothetical protein
VKSWFGRIESKCGERERVLLPGEGGEGCPVLEIRVGNGFKGMKYL